MPTNRHNHHHHNQSQQQLKALIKAKAKTRRRIQKLISLVLKQQLQFRLMKMNSTIQQQHRPITNESQQIHMSHPHRRHRPIRHQYWKTVLIRQQFRRRRLRHFRPSHRLLMLITRTIY